MSILNVEHLTHGFGDRAIFNDVSFRLLKGEHIGLIGANGEGGMGEECPRRLSGPAYSADPRYDDPSGTGFRF